MAVLGHLCGVRYLWSPQLPVVQSLFCLAFTMGEQGQVICAGNFKDVFWFTFCYNEVNANCFYVVFKKFVILLVFGRGIIRGVNKYWLWFIIWCGLTLKKKKKKSNRCWCWFLVFNRNLHFTIFQILLGCRFVLAEENAKFPFRYICFASGKLPYCCPFPIFSEKAQTLPWNLRLTWTLFDALSKANWEALLLMEKALN